MIDLDRLGPSETSDGGLDDSYSGKVKPRDDLKASTDAFVDAQVHGGVGVNQSENYEIDHISNFLVFMANSQAPIKQVMRN